MLLLQYILCITPEESICTYFIYMYVYIHFLLSILGNPQHRKSISACQGRKDVTFLLYIYGKLEIKKEKSHLLCLYICTYCLNKYMYIYFISFLRDYMQNEQKKKINSRKPSAKSICTICQRWVKRVRESFALIFKYILNVYKYNAKDYYFPRLIILCHIIALQSL